MRYITLLFCWFMAGLLSLTSCKKTEVSQLPLAALTIVNTTVNSDPIKIKLQTDSTPQYYASLNAINYGGNATYGVLSTKQIAITIASNLDTTKSLYGFKVNQLNKGNSYSLFLSGQKGAIDTVITQDKIPAFTDSLFAVRFINLSFNSPTISVKLTSTGNNFDFGTINYKDYTQFNSLSATKANTTYTLEIRNAITGVLISTYTFNNTNPVPRFSACTIAWIGNQSSSDAYAPKLIRINNY